MAHDFHGTLGRMQRPKDWPIPIDEGDEFRIKLEEFKIVTIEQF